MIPQEYNLSSKISRSIPRNLIILGVVLLFISIGYVQVIHGLPLNNYFHSYLFTFVFYMSIIFGSIFFVILQHLTRSEWSVVVRRIPETLMKNIELMIILVIPVLLGVFDLYHWSHKEAVEADHLLKGKSSFLNLEFFLIRVIFYFLATFFISRFYYRASIFQDKNGDQSITLKLEKYAPIATIIFALVITFFALDFMMTLNPHWYSTMWGVYFFAGSLVVGIAVIILISLFLRRIGFLKKIISIEHYHDLGKLLFSFNVFWSYIAFSQYMLIWYANIPEETIFFIDRINGSWLNVSILLVIGHIFIPIFCFISRNAKRNLKIQLIMGLWMVFMHVVDIYWLVLPNIDHYGVNISVVDFLNFFGVGCLFFGYFLKNLIKESIIPFNDPRLEESIKFENQ